MAEKLMDGVRRTLRLHHYSYETEKVYCQWVRRFIYFHNKRHPRDMGAAEVQAFLSDLAVAGRVSASTQNQALSALSFVTKARVQVQRIVRWHRHETNQMDGKI